MGGGPEVLAVKRELQSNCEKKSDDQLEAEPAGGYRGPFLLAVWPFLLEGRAGRAVTAHPS